jgi:tetratricopeptide (TPR) repeat protein
MMMTTTKSVLVSGFALLGAILLAGCSATSSANAGAEAPASQHLPEDRDPKLLLERGKAFAEVGDLLRAEQYLAAAAAAGAEDREVTPPLLRVCVALRHHRLAVEYAEAALGRHPKDAHLRFLTGALYVSTGDRERARVHLTTAGRELGADPEVQFSIAVFFRDQLSDPPKADPYFREYLRLAPGGNHRDEALASLMQKVEE